MSPECLRFFVFMISPSVQLLVAVSDMDEITIGEVHSRGNVSDRQLVVTSVGYHKITVVRGQQYVVFTADKVKVTQTSDNRATLGFVDWIYGPCTDDDSSKEQVTLLLYVIKIHFLT